MRVGSGSTLPATGVDLAGFGNLPGLYYTMGEWKFGRHNDNPTKVLKLSLRGANFAMKQSSISKIIQFSFITPLDLIIGDCFAGSAMHRNDIQTGWRAVYPNPRIPSVVGT